MQQATIRRLENHLEKIRDQIDMNPNEDEMVELAEKIKGDHSTMQEALQYAELSEQDYERLKTYIEDERQRYS
ncbi:MAG: hypothetical protein SXQ77_09135 [Halobacteria archaeon]|nr:hypothetical protein [Halobacteria archaeon]